MKKIKKALLSLMIAMVLVCGTVSLHPQSNPFVNEVEAKVRISNTKKILYVKKTTRLKVTGAKEKVKWSSSNKKVASVNKNGDVKGIKKGTATITAKVGGKKYTCKVTVRNPELSKKTITVNPGKTLKLTVKNAVGTVKWSTSNKAIATVTSGGVVKGIKKGTATITAVASGVKLKCTVTVASPAPRVVKVTGLTIAQTVKTLKIGDTFALNPIISPVNATNKGYTISSSNTKVAVVDSKGVVTAKADGKAEITVKTNDQGITKKCVVTVKTPLESISFEEKSFSLYPEETMQIDCKVNPVGIQTKIAYASDNTSVATVTEDGIICPKEYGEAHITVTVMDAYGNAKKETITVNVIRNIYEDLDFSIDISMEVEGINIIHDFSTDIKSNEETGEKMYVLLVKGSISEAKFRDYVKDCMEITPYYDSIKEFGIVDSELDDYVAKVVLKGDNKSREYYVSYERDFDIDDVSLPSLEGNEDGVGLISRYYCDGVNELGEKVWILHLEGFITEGEFVSQLEKLQVTVSGDAKVSNPTKTTKAGYCGEVTLSYEDGEDGESRTYYISYDESLEISSIRLADQEYEDGNAIYYYYDNDGVLFLVGFISQQEFEERILEELKINTCVPDVVKAYIEKIEGSEQSDYKYKVTIVDTSVSDGSRSKTYYIDYSNYSDIAL